MGKAREGSEQIHKKHNEAMNKVININLGGYPFTIDDDAYKQLDNYFRILKKHFKNSDGKDEIMHDIESRMAELFNDKLGNIRIISKKEVDNVIGIMGMPKEIGLDDEFDEIQEDEKSFSTSAANRRTDRRFFRDPDSKVIAGVVSGLSAYLGIKDPVWMRILFVLLALSGGLAIFAYVILWIIIPEANTSADRLAMQGEPINIDNIAKQVEDEITELSDRISKLDKKWRSSKKKRNGASNE